MSIYIKLDGISGNVSDKHHKDWIQVSNVNFRVERPSTVRFGKKENIEYTNPRFSKVKITKLVDKTSPVLFQACCIAKPFDKIIIQSTHSDDAECYLEYTLENAMITSYDTAGFGGEHHGSEFTEELMIGYGKVTMKYIPMDASHRAQAPISAGYDLTVCQKV